MRLCLLVQRIIKQTIQLLALTGAAVVHAFPPPSLLLLASRLKSYKQRTFRTHKLKTLNSESNEIEKVSFMMLK